MDAIEFIKERMRMCDKMGSCSKCPLYNELKYCDLDTENPNKLVSFVEQWSKEHPQKTMMQDFFEKFPNAPRSKFNHPTFCPGNCGYNNETPNYEICKKFNEDCLKCWSRPLEES